MDAGCCSSNCFEKLPLLNKLRNNLVCDYCDEAADEIERLRGEMQRLAVGNLEAQHLAARENKRLREQLYDATKAGTPYAKEQDSINGLVVDNSNKTAEIKRLKIQKIKWQSMTYHAMNLVDRIVGGSTCEDTFMGDVDKAMKIVNGVGAHILPRRTELSEDES